MMIYCVFKPVSWAADTDECSNLMLQHIHPYTSIYIIYVTPTATTYTTFAINVQCIVYPSVFQYNTISCKYNIKIMKMYLVMCKIQTILYLRND